MAIDIRDTTDQQTGAGELYQQTGRIARQLGEVQVRPLRLIKRAICQLGYERVQALVDQAVVIEANGGEWLERQQRKRTLGGIFFRLLRDSVSEEDRVRLGLVRDWQVERARRRQVQPAPDPLDGPTEWLTDVLNDAGEVQDMDVSLVGTVGKAIEQAGVVIASFKRTQQLTLPRDLPALPQGHGHYLCFISKKQWDRLGELTPDDTLTVKGYATLHPKFSRGIVVYVESVTKKPAPKAP